MGWWSTLSKWLAFQWPLALEYISILVKELILVVMAAALFWWSWKGKLVIFSVDNEVVLYILSKTHSRESDLIHLIRLLVFYTAHFDFWFRTEYIPWKSN
uniref:Reverse transcriptase RNase H-like domain-containing protein n=1 Tax=Amphimedon queenslandica TaxID=400682 RepID=A0A1X7TBG8_AMPQE